MCSCGSDGSSGNSPGPSGNSPGTLHGAAAGLGRGLAPVPPLPHGSSSLRLGAKRAFNEHSQKGSEDQKCFWNKGFYKGKYIEMVSTNKILVLVYCEERWLLWHFSPFYCKEGKEGF